MNQSVNHSMTHATNAPISASTNIPLNFFTESYNTVRAAKLTGADTADVLQPMGGT